MTKESIIRLLICKSCAYKSGYDRAVLHKNFTAAIKWKDGYHCIIERINELKEAL